MPHAKETTVRNAQDTAHAKAYRRHGHGTFGCAIACGIRQHRRQARCRHVGHLCGGCVDDGILVVHTNPIIAFAGPYPDGACVPYDVSCAIAATVNHRMLDGIVVILPDGSVRDIATDDLVCVPEETDAADKAGE